jgi:hypothetical protein
MEPREEEQDCRQEQPREPQPQPQPQPRQDRFRIEPLEERIAPGINRLGSD